MDAYTLIYDFVSANKELLRLFYSLFIALICFVIFIKTDKLFRISYHQGIRYFRNAFFFYGVGFILRYLTNFPFLVKPFFEFFITMGGFFLLYSLIWKKFENEKLPSNSSLFNPRVIIFYILTIVLVVFDFLWNNHNFMFASQIIIFAVASVISYNNYRLKKKYKFRKSYFVVMILSFVAWFLNFIFANFFQGRLRFLANVYIINVIIFMIFLYGVLKLTKKAR